MRKQTLLSLLFPLYLATVLFTDISLTGFWTDVIVAVVLSGLAIKFARKKKTHKSWQNTFVRASNILCATIVFVILGLNLINPFSWDTLKLRSFYFHSVEDRLFNAYFKPVGAYSGGYGNFRITETPAYFPAIEWRVYWNRTIHHDFMEDSFKSIPVNHDSVIQAYIRKEVLKEKPQKLQREQKF